jgi:DNA-binding winged helix-turn-helix (wHTH) protein/tetratricopeptide (TPR) repeat protein
MGAEILRFEDFELDRGAYELRRAGQVVHLERIPLDLLLVLVEARGQLVTRHQIVERIWGKGVFIDSDNSINIAARKLRLALNDNAGQPRFFVAVHGKGYRFVAQVREASAGLAQVRPTRSSLVGREREMADLRGGLAEAAAGRGGLCLIAGGPGIGKTRLTQELAALAQASQMAVLAGHCSERIEAVPFLPFVEILESCVDAMASPDGLRRLLGAEGPDLARLLPKLKRVLPDLPPPLELAPDQARRHLLNCFCGFAGRVASQGPALMVLDDLHWADDSTLAMLGHLAQRLSNLPLLVIGTYREVELDVSGALAKTLEDLIRGRLAIEVRLKELARDEVAQMLTSLSGQAPPAAVVSEFYEETKGNPFFVEELFRHLAEENRLYDARGSFRPELRIAELEVPRSVRLVVGRRLARLSEPARRMLDTAAVIGRSFTLKVLAAATAAEGLVERVAEAERAGLIFSGTGSSQFEFSHELIRQTVLSALAGARRQQLHLAVAGELEAIYEDTLEDHYTGLIHHNVRGGDVHRALHYLELAAERPFALGAFEQALTLSRSALDLLENLPEGGDRTRQEVRWQRSFSLALSVCKGHEGEEVLAAFRRLAELSRRAGNRVELMDAIRQIGLHHLSRGELHQAREVLEELVALAQRAGDGFQEAWARLDLAETLMCLGELSRAREHIETAEAYCDSAPVFPGQPDRAYTSFQPWNLRARDYNVPQLLWYLGFPDQARKKAQEAAAAAESAHPMLRSYALWNVALVHAHCHEPQAVKERMDQMLQVIERNDLSPSFLIAVARLRASVLFLSGQFEAALAILRDCHATGSQSAGMQIWLAAALVRAGHATEALESADRAVAPLNEFRVLDAEAHRVRGEALLVQAEPRWDEAERSFRTAIEIARRQGAKSLELRAATSLARMLTRQGRRLEGRAMLAEIYGWFTEGFDTGDLKDANALLNELNA